MAWEILFEIQILQVLTEQQKDRAVSVAELVQRRETTVHHLNCQVVLHYFEHPCQDLRKHYNLVSLVVMKKAGREWNWSLTCQKEK